MEIYRVGSNWLSCWSCPCTTKHWCLVRSNCNLTAHLSLCDGLVNLVHPNVKFFLCQWFLQAFAKPKAYQVGFNSLKHKHLIHYWSRKKIRLILEAADTFYNIKLGHIWPTYTKSKPPSSDNCVRRGMKHISKQWGTVGCCRFMSPNALQRHVSLT